jgi:hypothetical protein
MQIPLNERSTIRGLAQHLGVSHSTLHNMINEEDSLLHLHTSSRKPVLSDENKVTRNIKRYILAVSETDPESTTQRKGH